MEAVIIPAVILLVGSVVSLIILYWAELRAALGVLVLMLAGVAGCTEKREVRVITVTRSSQWLDENIVRTTLEDIHTKDRFIVNGDFGKPDNTTFVFTRQKG